MATTCECVLTRIDNHISPRDIYVSFSSEILLGQPPVILQIPINEYLDSEKYSIVSAQDKTDDKSVNIIYDIPTEMIQYTIDTSSGYWKGGRSDQFEVQYKDDFTGESTFITIHINCITYDPAFTASNISITLTYPYPESVRVNLVPAMGAITEFMYFKSGPSDPAFINNIKESEYGSKEVWVDLPQLADYSASSSSTSFDFYVANKTEGPVDEQTDSIAFNNITITFN